MTSYYPLLRHIIRGHLFEKYLYSIQRPFSISVPSMIGLECESGNVDDCDLSMTMEVLPFSCKGILMFSTESERDCGTKCDESQSRNSKSPTRRGWTKYTRYNMTHIILYES